MMSVTKKAVVTVVMAVFCLSAHAQTASEARKYESVKVKAFVLDSRTAEPIPYVSVYLIPKGDTTVTSFAVSDTAGKAVMDNVLPGQYELNAEHIGYLPFRKVFEITSARGPELDLGLRLSDILNRTNNLMRTVSAEFVEDRYSNVLGRTLLLSISFNFGKINQDKTAAVSRGLKQFEF